MSNMIDLKEEKIDGTIITIIITTIMRVIWITDIIIITTIEIILINKDKVDTIKIISMIKIIQRIKIIITLWIKDKIQIIMVIEINIMIKNLRERCNKTITSITE